MSEAPERIYMDPDIKFPECEKQYGCDVEYVRADLVERLRDRDHVGTPTEERNLVTSAADRIEELEAKLAKAVQSLKRLSTAECFGSGEVLGLCLSESSLGREILTRMDYANTALAALKGQDDE